jgi:hypothetical protein
MPFLCSEPGNFRLAAGLMAFFSAKTPPQKVKHKKSKTSPRSAYAASTLSMAAKNLINMVAVSAGWGTVLLGLLAAKHL